MGGLLKAAFRLFLSVAVVVVAGLFFLTRVQSGQRWVVGQVLDRVTAGLDGTVTVRDVESSDLLGGVLLRGISVVDPRGDMFLEVDSLRGSYSVPGLLGGPVGFSDVVVWGPRVRIATLPGEERSNLDAIFGGGEAGEGPGREVVLRGVRIVGGSVEVLQPVKGEVPERAAVVDAPGGPVRRIAVTGIAADLPRAVLSSPDMEGVELTVASLALEAFIFAEPLRVEDMRGVARYTDGEVRLEAEGLRLPGSELSGTLSARLASPGGPMLTMEWDAAPLDLDDVRWADPRVPTGTVRGGLGLVLGPDGMEATFEEAAAELEADRIRADGRVATTGSTVRFSGFDLELGDVDVDRLRPWVEAELPVQGRLRGSLSLDGPLDGVRTAGRLTLVPPEGEDAATTVELDGVVRAGADPGARELVAVFDPLDFGTLARLAGDSSVVGGRGSVTVEATGSLSEGLHFTARVEHGAVGLPTSRITGQGSVLRNDGELVLDIQGDVAPLSLTTLNRYWPDVPVTGEVSGSLRAVGRLSDLTLTAILDTEAGRLDLEGRFDVRRPAEGYRVEGTVENLPLSRFVVGLPDPSHVSGDFLVEGRGLSADSARATGRVVMRPSTFGRVPVDTLRMDFAVAGGGVDVDTLEALAVGVELGGRGRIPFRAGEEEGEFRLGFQGESLEGFRTLTRGEVVIARDTLEGLELDVVEASGVDLDTLPLLEEVAVGGRMRGDLVVRGSFEDFGLEGEARLEEVVWGTSSVRGLQVHVDATELPRLDGRIQATVTADSLDVLDRHFTSGSLSVDYTRPLGRVEALLTRNDGEDYRARARVEVDSLGGSVDLEELVLRFDTLSWSLRDPAAIRWDDESVYVEDLVVDRPGPEPMRIRADGRFPRRGAADFVLDVDGLHLPRLTQLAQREDLELEGFADLTLRVTGTASAPVIHGDVTAREVAYGSWDLDLLLGSFDYRDLRSAVDVRAWRDDLQVLVATGTVPVDLRLVDVEKRIPDGETMDVRVVADSLPAAFAVTLVEALDDVRGTIAGDFRIGGTVTEPSPSGTLAIQNGAWTLTALGTRQEDVQGTLTLEPDGTVVVDARARSGGQVRVTGSMGLEPLDDPSFDLLLIFNGFRAIDRRDMAGVVSGEVSLGGSFRQPFVHGLEGQGRGLSARGDLFVEEFQRTAGVIDLSDPRFASFLDQDLLEGAQPIIAGSQNPFLNNLRVEVDVTVERDTWLRSADMNVEIAGDLTMTYQRQQRDLVLQGTLEAVRGSYTTFGRRFDVQEGTVDFVGTPGVNPNLSIVATTVVRSPGSDPLNITAIVTGTLANPRLRLNSDETAVAQEDLVSYLLFGRPSYELTSGQAQGVQEASALLGTTVATGLSAGFGTLTSRISTLLGQRFGLDYFAINSGSVGLTGGTTSGALAQTTIEFGDYLGDELFWVLTLRPVGYDGGGTLGALPGVRLEWQATDSYRIEAFIDDRFLRSGAVGFRELAFKPSRVFGLNLFREWTY